MFSKLNRQAWYCAKMPRMIKTHGEQAILYTLNGLEVQILKKRLKREGLIARFKEWIL